MNDQLSLTSQGMHSKVILPRPRRGMRIIAVPLTRPLPGSGSEEILTYYQFQITPPIHRPRHWGTKILDHIFGHQSDPRGYNPQNSRTGSFGDPSRASSWQRKLYKLGEKLDDELTFEEVALKEIDLPLTSSISKKSLMERNHNVLPIPLFYPACMGDGSKVLARLQKFAIQQQEYHVQRSSGENHAIITMRSASSSRWPPFVWREASHKKGMAHAVDRQLVINIKVAAIAAEYLIALLDIKCIIPKPHEELSEIYDGYFPRAPTSSHQISRPQISRLHRHGFLLGMEAIPEILEIFSLRHGAEDDLRRALRQAQNRIIADTVDKKVRGFALRDKASGDNAMRAMTETTKLSV
ncbi:hypothetical protein M422DRAFT_43449 [Sphaerobolus stellatus SS14]|nr:hypothetical protein M422DRAFT_43449 [Sphaerobolus stellatus SS14]